MLPQVFLQVNHGDLHAGEHSQTWWAVVVYSPDVVMIFARVRRLSMVSVQAISGAGSIEYFIVFHTYYKYTTGLVFLCFQG